MTGVQTCALPIWLVERLVPAPDDAAAARLDRRLLPDPASAMDAAAGALEALARDGFALARARMARAAPHPGDGRAARLETGLAALEDYLEAAAASETGAGPNRRRAHALHALDHLARLAHRCTQADRIDTLARDPRLARLARVEAERVRRALAGDDLSAHAGRLNRVRRLLRRERERFRETTVAAAAARGLSPDAAIARLDAVRWLHRTAYHLWRIAHHLGRVRSEAPAPAAAPRDED